MIVCDEHQGAIAKATIGESIDEGYDIAIIQALPSLDRSDRFFIG